MNRALLAAAVALSLAANVLLVVRWRPALRPAETPAIALRAAPAPATSARSVDPETWTRLDAAGEPAEFVARLRAKGYPPAVIRAIVRAQLNERFADRLKAINDAIAAQPYWRGQGYMTDPKISAAQRALNREINDAMRSLLGASFNDLGDAERTALVRRFGDLPPGKIDALQQIASDYGDMMNEVRAAARTSGGTMLLPEDTKKLALLEREMRADIANVLTPEELDAYDLRTSRTANTLRNQLQAFEPTEPEFLALYQINKAFDDRYASMETLTPDQRRERADAQKQLAPEIQAALGPDRYADYERKTDPVWLQNNRFASEFDLPPTAVDQLFAIQKDLTDRAKAIKQGNPPYEQLSAQLTALDQEATLRLTPVLGDQLLGGYRSGYGYWLRELQPPPRPPPKP